MPEATLKALVEAGVADIALALARREKLAEPDAMAAVYGSDFYRRLANAKSGLYQESAASLAHLFMKERQNGAA